MDKVEQIKKRKKAQHEYYLRTKDRFVERGKKWRENNRDKFISSISESRRRRVEALREQGCTNAWRVVNEGMKPKFKGDK